MVSYEIKSDLHRKRSFLIAGLGAFETSVVELHLLLAPESHLWPLL